MTDQDYDIDEGDAPARRTTRQRAIEAYESAGRRAGNSLSEAPLIALAGGLAAGAVIAALLPRTAAEARLVRPTARRVKKTARAAFEAARDTGNDRLNELGLNRQKGEETIRSLIDGLTDAAKASGKAAYDAARNNR